MKEIVEAQLAQAKQQRDMMQFERTQILTKMDLLQGRVNDLNRGIEQQNGAISVCETILTTPETAPPENPAEKAEVSGENPATPENAEEAQGTP